MTVVAVASPASRCCWRSSERCARPCASAVTLAKRKVAAPSSSREGRSIRRDAAECVRVTIVRSFLLTSCGWRSAAQLPGGERRLRRGGGKRLRPEAEFDERFDEHAL